MKQIKNPTLLRRYLSSPPYVHYFQTARWEGAHIVDYSAGEYVLRQTAPPDHLCLMLTGRCYVRFFLSNGRSVILQSRTRILAIPLSRCREDLLRDPHFLRQVCSDLILKERSNSLSLIHTFGYPLENRLAKFILDNRQENRFYIRKTLVAESLGASYRHVGAVFSSFVQKGWLTKEKLVYTIADEPALAALTRELEPFSGPWHPPTP